MKNNPSFGNGQGNQLTGPSYSRGIAFGIVALALILIFIFKKQIKRRHEINEGKRFLVIFKDRDEFLRYFAVLVLIYTFGKIGIYEANDYPFKGEHLMLHICRLHLIVMMIFLIIKKKELIKYTTYISSMGALLAFTFGSVDGSLNVNGDYLTGVPITYKGTLLLENGFEFYHQGVDNFFFGDFYVTHLFITIFPIFMGTANSGKITTVKLHRSQLVYFVGIILIGTFNVISQYMPSEGHANNGYIGLNEYNDQSDALGWLSRGPQNLPFYLIIGVVVSMLLHLAGIGQSMISFQGSKKPFKIVKNSLGKDFTSAYDKKIFKKIFLPSIKKAKE